MSWSAHDLEPYVIQRHLGGRVAILPLLIGSYSPDILTKWFIYGVEVFGVELKAADAVQYHRGWPGFGFTHSLAFGVVLALAVWALTRSRVWSLSLLIGHWAHSISDITDTVGTMLFFPLTDHRFSIGMWAYAGDLGRELDAAAYYSGPSVLWDGFWVAFALLSWRVLTRAYFRETIVPADPFWRWAGRYLPEQALLALYRSLFFYGVARWVAWLLWAHAVHDFPWDLGWGGPEWVDDPVPPEG